MTDLDELVAGSRASKGWDVESPPDLVATALRRGRRRRRWQSVTGGVAVALAAVTVLVVTGHRADTTLPTSPATAVGPTGPLTSAQATAVNEDAKALDAWEAVGADSSIIVLEGTFSPWSVPVVNRRSRPVLTITKADPGSRSIVVLMGPKSDPCSNFDVLPVESRHGVVLTVVNRPHVVGALCQTGKEQMHNLIVPLRSPLGDRVLFDGATGLRLRPDIPK